MYTVTGEVPEEGKVEDLIERGESEQIFQQAIKSGGRLEVRSPHWRGDVCVLFCIRTCRLAQVAHCRTWG